MAFGLRHEELAFVGAGPDEDAPGVRSVVRRGIDRRLQIGVRGGNIGGHDRIEPVFRRDRIRIGLESAGRK